MSGPSALILCRRCGWDRPPSWFVVEELLPNPGSGVAVIDPIVLTQHRVKECRACRDNWPDPSDQYDTWATQP